MTTKIELSEDAKKLLNLRYCKLDEEPEDVYSRVAKALGEHDGYEKEFLEIMASKRFLPNSPTLMNAGLSNTLKACFVLPIHDSMKSIFQTLKDSALIFQSGGGCFTEKTGITTHEGTSQINKIDVGEKIFSMEGEHSYIDKIYERSFVGNIYRIKSQGCLAFEVTPEHPILVMRNGEREWESASNIKKNDYLCIPRIKRNRQLEKINLESYTKYPNNLKVKSIPFDKNFGWFLGLYMADGSSDLKETKISLSFNVTEQDLIERSKKYIRKMGYRVWERARTNCVDVTFSAVALARYLQLHIGKYAHIKQIPDDIFYNKSNEIIGSFVQGYWEGDGTKSESSISFKTASPHIAYQLQLLGISMGIHFGIAKGERKKHIILGKRIRHLRPFYQIYATSKLAMDLVGTKKMHKENVSRFKFDDKFCYVPVRKIESYPFRGKVYNLSVDETHTYLAQNIVVHNCGFNFSELRQEGSPLSRGGSSSGVMSFIELFNSLTEAVKSAGRRRGASMAVLNADHPQILDFAKAKLTPEALSNFNLSVLLDNQFMERITTDEYIYLRDRKDKRRTVGKYKIRDLFNIITFAAYLTGDPGLLFYDRINQDNPFKEKIKATNPCVTGNTIITTPKGYKRAKDIRVGDEIRTGEDTIGIVDTIEHYTSVSTFCVEMRCGDFIEATASHQFYARKKNTWMIQFLRLDQLNPEDMLIKFDSQVECHIKSITLIGNQEVYDIHEPITDTWITNGYISRGCGEVCMLPYESCIAEGTLIVTQKGLQLIENIEVGQEVLSHTEVGAWQYLYLQKKIPRGISKTLYIELENGMELTATHDHRIQTRDGWHQMDELRIGEDVSVLGNHVEIERDVGYEFSPIFYIDEGPEIKVYDLALGEPHNFVANGIVVHNCCLGSINLNEHIVDNDIDWTKFKETAEIGSQMLLSINKYSEYPVDECYKQNYKMNRIGLGLMGFADALMKMHIKYDSDETLELIDKITKCMYGVAKKKAPSSASVLSIAPTGSLSILASCSPSIEPIFSESYIRNLTFGTINETREKNEYMRTAHEISPMWHLKIQAQFQKTIDNAVSKCLREGTRIPTTKGLIPIESLHRGMEKGFQEIDDKIYIFDDQLKRKRILRSYYDGEGEIISIQTEDGFTLEGSVTHRIMTNVGWKTLYELKMGDYAARYENETVQYKKIKSVKNIEIDHLFDIEVEGNHTYLVNGFITHNTVNLQHDATIQDIYDVYYNAWKMGCKGVTVFRDGSKGEQVMVSKSRPKCDGNTCNL